MNAVDYKEFLSDGDLGGGWCYWQGRSSSARFPMVASTETCWQDRMRTRDSPCLPKEVIVPVSSTNLDYHVASDMDDCDSLIGLVLLQDESAHSKTSQATSETLQGSSFYDFGAVLQGGDNYENGYESSLDMIGPDPDHDHGTLLYQYSQDSCDASLDGMDASFEVDKTYQLYGSQKVPSKVFGPLHVLGRDIVFQHSAPKSPTLSVSSSQERLITPTRSRKILPKATEIKATKCQSRIKPQRYLVDDEGEDDDEEEELPFLFNIALPFMPDCSHASSIFYASDDAEKSQYDSSDSSQSYQWMLSREAVDGKKWRTNNRRGNKRMLSPGTLETASSSISSI